MFINFSRVFTLVSKVVALPNSIGFTGSAKQAFPVPTTGLTGVLIKLNLTWSDRRNENFQPGTYLGINLNMLNLKLHITEEWHVTMSVTPQMNCDYCLVK